MGVGDAEDEGAPQSWPTRSTGASRASISPRSHSTYSSLVAPKPSGRGQPKPGSDSATDSASMASRTFLQMAAVSGTPWTNADHGHSSIEMAARSGQERTALRADSRLLGRDLLVGDLAVAVVVGARTPPAPEL